jgi:hypothetical protein
MRRLPKNGSPISLIPLGWLGFWRQGCLIGYKQTTAGSLLGASLTLASSPVGARWKRAVPGKCRAASPVGARWKGPVPEGRHTFSPVTAKTIAGLRQGWHSIRFGGERMSCRILICQKISRLSSTFRRVTENREASRTGVAGNLELLRGLAPGSGGAAQPLDEEWACGPVRRILTTPASRGALRARPKRRQGGALQRLRLRECPKSRVTRSLTALPAAKPRDKTRSLQIWC